METSRSRREPKRCRIQRRLIRSWPLRMKRGKRKAKKGFVYILHAIHEGINIYKYGATTNNPESRLKYAKSRVWRGTDIQNKLDFKIIIESKQKDIFHVEGSITTMVKLWLK